MNEKLKVSDGLKVWIQDFLDSSAPQFKGKSPKERIKMAIAAFRDAGGKLKEGNMKERMDQSKLTGQEISVYFRKNPKAGKDKLVKKAVEFALDHGGAMSYAIKGIEKMKRGLSKHPDVKKALRYANESVHHESVWTVKNIVQENYTRNFETLCNSLKLNGIQQKILDDFIHKGRIRDQYVGRVAGSKKETRIFAGKKKFTGSIENRNEALTQALKVNAKQKSILDAYLKTGKVIGKYTGSMAGSTKTTKEYKGFRGFKEHFEARTIFETNLIIEGYSKKMSEKEVKAIEKKYGPMDKAERADYLDTQYSPAKTARPDAWLAIAYPVKDGEYYFALLGNQAQGKKWNDIMNAKLQSLAKTIKDPDELYDAFYTWADNDVPSRAGVGDTMTREEIWAACLHILRKKVATVYVDESVEEGFFKNLLKRFKRGIRLVKPKSKPKKIKEDVNERAYSRDEKLVQQAVGIAMNMGGNMTGAYKKIEKLKRGLGDHPVVKAALRLANESVEEAVISELTMKQIRRKHSAPLRKAMRSGNLELPQDTEEALYQWAFDNGEIKTDDPDEFTDWLDSNLDDIVRGKLD